MASPRLFRCLSIVLVAVGLLAPQLPHASAAALYSDYGIRRGDQRIGVLVLDLDWSPRPEMVAKAQNLLTGQDRTPYSVQQYFAAVSRGAINFDFEVMGPFSVAADQCSHDAIVQAGNAAFIQAGGDPGQYDSMMYITEEGPAGGCSYSGGSYQGEYQPDTNTLVLYGKLSAGLIIHELGHELGLKHAESYACQDVSLGAAGCLVDERGDPTDLMGYPWVTSMFYSFNAPHRISMGLVPGDQVKTLRRSGTYTMIGSETERDGTHVLAIPANGGALGTATTIFVEYRQPLPGFGQSRTSEIVVTAWTQGGDQPTYYLGSLNCRRTACDSLTLHSGTVSLTITAQYEGKTQAKVSVEVQDLTGAPDSALMVTQALG